MKLSHLQRQRFQQDGYLIVEQALTDSDLEPVIGEYQAYIGQRAVELAAEGKLSDTCTGQPFERRLAGICRQNNELFSELDIMQLRGKATFEFLGNTTLLDWVEDFIGPEITCSPIQHLRPKLPTPLALDDNPEHTHVAPWHQDAGVTWPEADDHFILTVWVPLVEANVDNGCLEIIPGVHGAGLLTHHSDRQHGTEIVAEQMPEQEPLRLPMSKGDVLFMHKEIPHRSLPNRSDTVRWSMDLRYQKTGTPTGRPFHPEFVVRSRADPASALSDHSEWSQRWQTALRDNAGVRAHRWPLQTAG